MQCLTPNLDAPFLSQTTCSVGRIPQSGIDHGYRNDGRSLVGQMLAYDKHMNFVLAECEEFRTVKVGPTPLQALVWRLTDWV